MNKQRRNKPMKISKCACGYEALVFGYKDEFNVGCNLICWEGPTRKTKLGAIKAWNGVMK